MQRDTNPVLKQSVAPARDCLYRAAESSWWEWLAGSTLFFWRWPKSYLLWAREGQPCFAVGTMPVFKRKQGKAKCEEDRLKMKAKVDKVWKRKYIECGTVLSLTHMLYVPKGKQDIRMVYNGTSCGLNDVLWAPHFGLPIVQHTLRSLLTGYHQCDMDVGEIFLNYWLNPELRPYAGVDITHVRGAGKDCPGWE